MKIKKHFTSEFLGIKDQIDSLMAEIAVRSENHFDTNPDDIGIRELKLLELAMMNIDNAKKLIESI